MTFVKLPDMYPTAQHCDAETQVTADRVLEGGGLGELSIVHEVPSHRSIRTWAALPPFPTAQQFVAETHAIP